MAATAPTLSDIGHTGGSRIEGLGNFDVTVELLMSYMMGFQSSCFGFP